MPLSKDGRRNYGANVGSRNEHRSVPKRVEKVEVCVGFDVCWMGDGLSGPLEIL